MSDVDKRENEAEENKAPDPTPNPEQTPKPDPPPAPDRPWVVTAARDLSTAYLDFAPEPGSELPDAREILDRAIALGVPSDLLFAEETLSRALANTLHSGIPLKQYAFTEDRDASFAITVSEDKLRADLSIAKGCGRGKALDLKELGAAIRASGLKGMDFEKIKKDILAFYRGEEMRLADYLLAEGKAAEPGKPQELTWEVEFLSESDVAEHKQKSLEAPPVLHEEIASLAEKPVAEISEMAPVGSESIVVSISPKDAGEPGLDVYGKTISPPAPVPLAVEIREHLRIGQDAVIAETDGMLDRWESDSGSHIIRVRPFRDSSVVVNISADAMLGSVKLTEGIGAGTHLTVESVRQALIDAGVIKGIDMDALAEAVRRASEEGDDTEIVVARGQPPVEPGASRIKFHVPLASGKAVTILPDGTADFKNQDRISTVDTDELIAEIVSAAVEKKDGWDVRSKVLKAKESPQLQIDLGEGIREEQDENGYIKLFATKPGELLYDGKSLLIGEIHTITGDVGPASGNVKFGGSVNITGSVLAGYFVMSKGTVKIAESVEASLVSADESIHIQHGVKGAKKAALRARQEISAEFIEQATVMAIGDINVQNSCLHCNIKCTGTLSLLGEKGKLVGGRIRVRHGVSAQQIGTAVGVHTEISFGQDYLIGDKIELEEKEIKKLQTELMRLEGAIHAAERDGAEADVKKGRGRKVQILKLLEKRTERLFWLRERFEQHFPSRVEVRGTIYPGVILESHGRVLEIASEKKNVVFKFDPESGHIVEGPREADSS